MSRSEGSIDDHVAALQDKYQEVFLDTLETIIPFQAKLRVKKDARPKFFKPRSVPFALRERVEHELDRLEKDGVLQKTPYSEWAAPIVAVPKREGRIHLCGNYKVTVNPVLDVDQYPLPKPEDIFATLSGGKKFTTLDLSHGNMSLLIPTRVSINSAAFPLGSLPLLLFFRGLWIQSSKESRVSPVT